MISILQMEKMKIQNTTNKDKRKIIVPKPGEKSVTNSFHLFINSS